jgi:hypothetical protein
MPKEVIHVQLGTFANYLGTHFWNLEDELCRYDEPDIVPEVNRSLLFRSHDSGKGAVTHVPRLVICELPQQLGALSQLGTLHKDTKTDLARLYPQTWDGKVQTTQAPKIEKSLFIQDLEGEDSVRSSSSAENSNTQAKLEEMPQARFSDSQVRYWSDFSKVHYHHRTIQPLHGVFGDFDTFCQGQDAARNTDFFDDLSDRVRYFAEECDTLQGIHYSVDLDSGFAGIGLSLLEELRDTYRVPVLTTGLSGLERKTPTSDQARRIFLNSAYASSRLMAQSSIYVPLVTQMPLAARI